MTHLTNKKRNGLQLIPLFITAFLFLNACVQEPSAVPPQPVIQTSPSPTPQPTLIPSHQPTSPHQSTIDYTCADLDTFWGNDWANTIQAIHYLQDNNIDCGPQNLSEKLYAAYFSYAVSLENEQNLPQAIEQYQQAFALNGTRREALDALVRLQALPEPTPVACDESFTQTLMPSITVPEGNFVEVDRSTFSLNGEPFLVKGVNYYPRLAPWHRFITEANRDDITEELALIGTAGFNTIRIFLWYQPLFTCAPEDAIPIPERLERIDWLLNTAHEQNLKVIVTLHDLPDLLFRPLYTDKEHYRAQTEFLVTRYANHPAILAWDLRNEGDLDYGARHPAEETFTQEEVISWLAETSATVRSIDQNHLITAGWWGDPQATAPYVDFLSFHHWYDSQQLRERITAYQAASDQPILLKEIGYHSWSTAPQDARTEETQAQLLKEALDTAEDMELAGWVVWTAFDFVPSSDTDHFENHFGLWRTDLTPKPILSTIMQK